MTEIFKRYDFVLLFDVVDGNPNGDPDAGNLPRLDVESGHGLVTDVCIKRKIRNYVGLTKQMQQPYDIYVKEKAVLGRAHTKAFKEIGIDLGDEKTRTPKADEVEKGKNWMCKNFYDIRTFGAVMSLKSAPNCGQVRGPVQFTFARSIDPVVAIEHSITRMAVATEAEADKQSGDNRTMGRKSTVAYGLYRAHGFISAPLANQTGFSQEDLELLWESLINMFEHDRSAARGMMSTRGLYIFEHDSKMGNVPAHELFERVTIKRKDATKTARSFVDYDICVNEADLNSCGIKCICKVGKCNTNLH